jgi:DNA replication protein DnaC
MLANEDDAIPVPTWQRPGEAQRRRDGRSRACRDNRTALYRRVPQLLEALGLARGDGRYGRMLKNLARVQLLILDDWASTPLTAEQRRNLMEIVDDRHDRASTIGVAHL